MVHDTHPALLPNGLSDLVPPLAAAEWQAVNHLIDAYSGYGYQLVKPPLMEFESGLLTGPGAALAPQTFRLMDPISRQMLGLRADITAQIARIAGSRLQSTPRPLRLAYAGEVVRVSGTQLRPERQFCQVGAELIGAMEPNADAEIMVMAVDALQSLDIPHISLDLSLPTLQPYFLERCGLAAPARDDLADAIRRRDSEAVRSSQAKDAFVIAALIDAAGPVDDALALLDKISIPTGLKGDIERLKAVVTTLKADLPGLMVTCDPLERRGFEYQTGLSFTLFARGVRGELGRGGRYRSAGTLIADQQNPTTQQDFASLGEPAVGFSLFMDSIMRGLRPTDTIKRLYVPTTLSLAERHDLIAEGWVVIRAVNDGLDANALQQVAEQAGCDHYWLDGAAHPTGRS
ncbi:MAG: ATP phosphoribosyltransferase regulatory subunit [Pseudomonadota bacterium]